MNLVQLHKNRPVLYFSVITLTPWHSPNLYTKWYQNFRSLGYPHGPICPDKDKLILPATALVQTVSWFRAWVAIVSFNQLPDLQSGLLPSSTSPSYRAHVTLLCSCDKAFSDSPLSFTINANSLAWHGKPLMSQLCSTVCLFRLVLFQFCLPPPLLPHHPYSSTPLFTLIHHLIVFEKCPMF